MKIKITRGPIASAVRAVIYGTEGIGKTTLASQFPNPLIIDTEDGSKHIDCARYVVSEWKNLTLAMAELAVDAQGFQTIVIDSARLGREAAGRVGALHQRKEIDRGLRFRQGLHPLAGGCHRVPAVSR